MAQHPVEHETVIVSINEAVEGDVAGQPVLEEELLVEEISIDGMCGVY
jgi:mycofactocin precursor